ARPALGRLAGEHVVGGDVDEPGAGATAGPRYVLRAACVDRVGRGRVALGAVDVGVGGAVDDHVATADVPFGRGGVGDVPLRRRQRQDVAPQIGGPRRPRRGPLARRAGDVD